MADFSEFIASVEKDKKVRMDYIKSSNPLFNKADETSIAVSDYTQSVPRPKYDKDVAEIVEIVRILNNMAPRTMPVYNFNIDEINGESFYKPDGTLLLVREDDSDVIRDYYADNSPNALSSVNRILEHDKNTGRLRVKIEPINRPGSRLNTNITIFDDKVNNKYILMQLSDGGVVNNISEFAGKGKAFQTLFRNIDTYKPARYLEGRDTKDMGFVMIDCIFDSSGSVARIRKYNSKREINIDYTADTKNITVKTKQV